VYDLLIQHKFENIKKDGMQFWTSGAFQLFLSSIFCVWSFPFFIL
jgi:hypothetical protein